MSDELRDPKSVDAARDSQAAGLDPDELRAEQAGDLPERDAMSVIGVGGLEVGLPPAGLLDDVLSADPPVSTLPVEQYPVDQLPVDRLPVEPLPSDLPDEITMPVRTIDGLPDGTPVDGDLQDLPASGDASVKV